MKFKIEKVANMIFITADQDIIFKAWDITEFTERKLQNTIKKINGHYKWQSWIYKDILKGACNNEGRQKI